MDTSMIISKLHLYHFRGLNDLMLDDLSLVNVFAGANNCGKTSVLEAITLLSNPSNVGALVRLSTLRAHASVETRKKNLINYLLSMLQKDVDQDVGSPFYHLKLGVETDGIYHLYEVSGGIDEVTDSAGEEKQTLKLTIKNTDGQGGKPDYQSVEFVNNESRGFVASRKNLYGSLYMHSSVNVYRVSVEMLSDYIIQEGKDDLLTIIKMFDPTIVDISIVGEDIYLHNSNGALPLFVYGAGMQKAVSLTAIIASRKNGVLLIDEIDNTIHVSAFEDVFRWFLDVCLTFHVQAFVTTHSAEALDAILRIAHDRYPNDDLIRVITLRKDYKAQTTKRRIRTGEEAYLDREQFGLELRV